MMTLNEMMVYNQFRIPPQPYFFPPTETLRLSPNELQESVRLIYDVPSDVTIRSLHQASSSSTMVTFRRWSNREVISMILNPRSVAKGQHVVQVCGGEVRPFSVPDISDLALLGKPVRIALLWMLQNSPKTSLGSIISFLRRETSPKLPLRMETCYLEHGLSEIDINSFSNYFKAVRVSTSRIESVKVSVMTSDLTTEPRDGRKTSLRFEAITRNKANQIEDLNHANLIIWNCRGVGETLFGSILKVILDLNWPAAVILVETRVDEQMLISVLKPFKVRGVRTLQPIGIAGGVALVTTSGEVNIKGRSMGNGTWEGCITFND